MRYDPKKEVRVLWVVKELGLASQDEVKDRYKEVFNEEYENVNLVLRRWKARKVFVMEGKRYKIADVPPWFKSLRMDQLVKLSKKESTGMLKDLEETFGGGPPVGGITMGKWRNFVKLELTIENIDPILGGRPMDPQVNGKTVFPREDKKLVVPINWMYGLTRDNQALMNVVGLHRHCAWGKGYWQGDIETITKTAPVVVRGKGVGVSQYESIPSGNRFIVTVRFPMVGCSINDIDQIKKWFDMLAETPIKGLGANSKAYGGRIRLLDIKQCD